MTYHDDTSSPPALRNTLHRPPRQSSESVQDDRRILDEEDEREELLTGRAPRRDAEKTGSLPTSTRRKNVKSQPPGHRREVMHEMEEGGPRSPTPSSSDGSDYDLFEKTPRPTKATRICRFTLIHLLIAILFVLIAFGAYKATQTTSIPVPLDNMRSNGTSLFAPTTILISLDGFRADYLARNLTPTLKSFILDGVSPKYMLPSFPSVTFPNHYTLVTGLYPESHGIVGNSFWDPAIKESFYYTDRKHSMQPKWWSDGEPIWETAEGQGARTAIHMWPGSEAHISTLEPAYIDNYNGSEVLSAKVDRMLGLLDKPGALDEDYDQSSPRPQLVAAYVPNVDAEGHLYGPNSTQVDAAISAVDGMLGDLLAGLQARNLTDVVNVVVVSDHGMATVSHVIQLEDLVDTSLIAHTDGWPHYGLRPYNLSIVPELHEQLQAKSNDHDGFDVFLREDMPERWHFQNNDRIAPLWLIPRTGWAIATLDEFDVQRGGDYHPKGVHGYDHEHPLMRAIFVARGPAFPHPKGAKLDVFQNIEVYNIVCDSLGIVPRPNNGTLRLPLASNGVHGEDDVDGGLSEVEGPKGADSDKDEGIVGIMTAPAEPAPTRPVISDDNNDDGGGTEQDKEEEAVEAEAELQRLWSWMTGQAHNFAEWAKQSFDQGSDTVSGWVNGRPVVNHGASAEPGVD